MAQKLFPIMLAGYQADERIKAVRNVGCCFAVVGVPWPMIAPHEAQARSNHSQTLKGLESRGGLSACEALAVLEDREWRRMDQGEAHARLADFILRANRMTAAA